MRIWSIHPKYLDAKGLVALWRETLLAKNVLEGKTKGYKNHSQLVRFKSVDTNSPLSFINLYLHYVHQEAGERGYKFDRSKIGYFNTSCSMSVNSEQIRFEFEHIKNKTQNRSKDWYEKIKSIENPEVHPIFYKVDGPIEKWEKT